MNKALSTLRQQRSFTADWLVSGEPLTLPQGILVDLSIVTSSPSPVYLGRMTIEYSVLSLSFEQNGAICAYGSIRGDGVTQSLQVSGSVISATVTTGSITGIDKTSYTPYRAQVSPDLVTVVGNLNEGVTTITVEQDGQETVYQLTSDLELIVSDNLELLYDDLTGEAVIGMSEENRAMFTQLVSPLVSVPTALVSVNNIKTSSGVLAITIETDGTKLPVTVNGTVVSIDGSAITLCAAAEDMIDSKISPELHISGYKPLDDMYVNGVRHTRDAVNKRYGLVDAFGAFNSTLNITDADPKIDCID